MMCDELNEELDNGNKIATELVNHVVHGMGAGGCRIPVSVDNIAYVVEVRLWNPDEV